MLDANNGDKKWRKTPIKGEDGLRIIECLRGRLLAERLASKAAKEEEEFMANKLMKLQEQLGKEIESRNEAERKLNFLKKKMEKLKLTDQRSSLEKTTSSSCSSTVTIIFQEPEEQNLRFDIAEHAKCCSVSEIEKMTDSYTAENVGNSCSEIRLLNRYLQTPAHGDNSTSVTSTAHSRNNSNDKLRKMEDEQSEELMINNLRQASTGKRGTITEENNQMKRMDNTLTLGLVQ